MNIKTAVITGGPCAGKSTVIEELSREFGDRIVVVPEVATLLISGGFPQAGKDVEFCDRWLTSLQDSILPVQMNIENESIQKAIRLGARLVIFDRGIADSEAYISDPSAFYTRHGLNRGEVLGRYDYVIHLESVATCKPSVYTTANNDARRETLEEAAALELRTRSAWESHANWIFISGKAGLSSVVDKVMGIVSEIVDVEVERKFILRSIPDIDIGDGVDVYQAYINSWNDNGNEEMRVRKIGDQHFLTVKSGSGESRHEWEKSIPEWAYRTIIDGQMTSVDLSKKRYFIIDGGTKYELDVYDGKLDGLIILEVQSDEGKELVLPDWAEVEREVTGEISNHNLAYLTSWGVGYR